MSYMVSFTNTKNIYTIFYVYKIKYYYANFVLFREKKIEAVMREKDILLKIKVSEYFELGYTF